MKIIFVIGLMLIINIYNKAQQNYFNAEVELQKIVGHSGTVKMTCPNIYKLTYRNGFSRVLNFNTSEDNFNYKKILDSTVINIWNIDTTKYSNMFKYWQKVVLINSLEETVPVDDINQNGFTELYGITRYNWPLGGQVDILEQDAQGIFRKVFSYDSTSIAVQSIGDVNGDGIKELHLRTTDTLNGKFYKTDSLSGLPTKFDFIFYYYPNQISGESFGDFDKNGINDCAFVDGSNPSRVVISEYRESINNFESVFEQIVDNDVPVGFSIGDFDEDNKTDLVYSTLWRNIYVIEATDSNQYSIVWRGTAPAYNAYMHTKTNDIDGNGKPEFWIGGEDFDHVVSKFYCFESNGDNSYTPVASIEFTDLAPLYTAFLQSADMDNDGKEELIFNLGNKLIILKFVGKPNEHIYEMYYFKSGELTQPLIGTYFLPSTIYDFNKDGKKDILLSMDIPTPPAISYILIGDSVTSIAEDKNGEINQFELFQNYPSPFNSTSVINFSINIFSNIEIKVYNILGKEVRTLLNKELSAGQYSVEWDGKDSEENKLTSGIYFINLRNKSSNKTIKTVLLK